MNAEDLSIQKTDIKVRALLLVCGLLFLTFGIIPFYRWCWGASPPDMKEFLIPWYQHVMRHGPLGAFSIPFSNYNPPYLYWLAGASLFDGLAQPSTLIRATSLAMTGVLAGCFYLLLRRSAVQKNIAVFGALALFAVPTVIINAVMLGQADMLWTAPCLLAVVAAVRGRPSWMCIWCGVAFAVKAQAVFLAPFAIGMLFQMNWRWYHALLPAGAYALCMVPALALGWPLADLAMVYFKQAAWNGSLVSVGAPNPWLIAAYLGHGSQPILIPIAGVLGVLSALIVGWACFKARPIKPSDYIALALLSALALPYFLPLMHGRFFFLADILALALACMDRSLRSTLIAGLVQLGSFAGMLVYISGEAIFAIDAGGQGRFALADGRNGMFGVIAVAAMSAALIMCWARVKQIGRGDLPVS